MTDILDIIRTEYARGTSIYDIAPMVDRSERAVRNIARRAGIVHVKTRVPYSPEDDAFILANRDVLGFAGIAQVLNRSAASIETRFRDLRRREAGVHAKPAPAPASAPVEVDPDAPFRTRSGIVAKRNRLGVSLPYIASLGG